MIINLRVYGFFVLILFGGLQKILLTLYLVFLTKGLGQDKRFSSSISIALFFINTDTLISLRGRGLKIYV